MKKVVIVGAGDTGSQIISWAQAKDLPLDFYLVDTDEKKEKAQILDLKDAGGFCKKTQIQGCEYGGQCMLSADIVIITAGVRQIVGETRCDLMRKNVALLKNIQKSLGRLKPSTLIILISNPVDIMTTLAQGIFDLPAQQIFGTGTLLDTMRMRWHVAEHLKHPPHTVQGYVLGEHGDSQSIAWSTVSQAGKIPETVKKHIEKSVANEAYRIIEGKGATYFGIASCVGHILQILAFNETAIMPLSVRGDYPVCIGQVCELSKAGAIPIATDITKEEAERVSLSAQKLKDLMDSCEV